MQCLFCGSTYKGPCCSKSLQNMWDFLSREHLSGIRGLTGCLAAPALDELYVNGLHRKYFAWHEV